MRRMISNTRYVFDWDPVLQAYTNSDKNVPVLPEGIYVVTWCSGSDNMSQTVIVNTYKNQYNYEDHASGVVNIADNPDENWVDVFLYIDNTFNGGGVAITTALFQDTVNYAGVKIFAYENTELVFTRIG